MVETSDSRSHYDGPRAIVSMVGLVVFAIFCTVVLPILLGGMVDRLGFSARDAGMVASAEMAGLFVATAGVMLVVHRWSRRLMVTGGLCLLVAADLASAMTDEFAMLAGVRFLAGIGAGAVIATVKACIAATSQPVRVIGILGMSVLLTGAVGLPIMPLSLAAWGMSGTYVLLAVIVLPGFVLLPSLPAHATTGARVHTARAKVDIGWAIVGLAALLCYFVGHGAIVPFLERLGIAAGVDAATAGQLLGAGSGAGVAGAALATWFGMRIGRVWPLAIGIACSLASITLLVYVGRPWAFGAGAVLLMAAAMFALPYCLGSLAGLDRQGRVLVAGLLMQSLGLAAGPALGGLLIRGSDYVPLGWLCFAGYVGSLVLFLPLLLRMDRHDRAPAPATMLSPPAGAEFRAGT